MKKYLYLALALLTATGAYGAATRIIQGDQIKSSDKTKTWSLPSSTDTLMGRAANETVSGSKIFSSAIQIPNGTGTTPGIWTDTGGGKTGFYFGANGATFAYNTADIASFAASSFRFNTQVNHFFNSTAGTPSIIFQEANSGIYRIAANNLGVSISSTKILDIASTGLSVTGALSSTGTATVGQLIDSGATATTVPYFNASKQLTSSSVTPTELGYLSGVTSGVQSQIDGKMTNPMTTSGDLIYGGSSGTPTRFAKCSNGQYLTWAAGVPSCGSGGGISQALYSGYHSGSCFWSTTSTSFVDPSDDGSCSLTAILNDGMGTVSTFGASKPGIVISSAPYTGTVEVCASSTVNPASNDSFNVALVDGSGTALNYAPLVYGGSTVIRAVNVCGFYAVTATTSYTFKLQIKTAAGFTGAIDGNGQSAAISWTVKYVK